MRQDRGRYVCMYVCVCVCAFPLIKFIFKYQPLYGYITSMVGWLLADIQINNEYSWLSTINNMSLDYKTQKV
ncbi:hypothetical protein AX774_g696 [Zancudomyces culisetae]|uniref:Uncharacterized protein n=1 Tax=Zancudomyces culisetae TaxID=1213189 RepID=A0A1R1PXV5_ZANCU|nr:hypothetical protein AX774_g696 [Zancudomyces culisetae]|eukprot:OMH85748.1 hypothetical protein AX774_g696 [Zancudomyces culisetae]